MCKFSPSTVRPFRPSDAIDRLHTFVRPDVLPDMADISNAVRTSSIIVVGNTTTTGSTIRIYMTPY